MISDSFATRSQKFREFSLNKIFGKAIVPAFGFIQLKRLEYLLKNPSSKERFFLIVFKCLLRIVSLARNAMSERISLDNSLGKGKARLSSFDEILKKANYSGNLKLKLDTKIKELYAQGRISPKQYKAYIK